MSFFKSSCCTMADESQVYSTVLLYCMLSLRNGSGRDDGVSMLQSVRISLRHNDEVHAKYGISYF